MAYSILRHLAFNEWANTKVAEVLKDVSDEIYFSENKSSFSSIAKTITHVWGAQVVWLTRMQGESLTSFPAGNAADKNSQLEGLIQSSKDIVQFVKSKDDSFLTSVYAYKSMAGISFEDSYEETLFHVVNHGSYHRGQIITMLRQAGVEKVVSTDLIHYLRTLKK